MKKKILVQFDGSNFYNKVKKILPQVHLTNFDYHGLAKLLVKNDQFQVVYYVGFENFISRALQKNCSSYLILKKTKSLSLLKLKEVDVLTYAFFRPNKYAYSEFRPF